MDYTTESQSNRGADVGIHVARWSEELMIGGGGVDDDGVCVG